MSWKDNLIYTFLLYIIVGMFSCNSEKDPQPSDCSRSDLEINITNTTDASCNIDDGAFSANATGGAEPYEFKISGGSFQLSGDFADLSAGTYSVTVRDDEGCEASINVQIMSENSTVAISTITTGDAGCGSAMGSVTVDASGDGALMYSIDGGSFQTSNIFTNLTAGNYLITVRDATDCSTSSSVDVLHGTSYEMEVEAIIMANCAIPTCHDGSSAQPNWTIFSNVQSSADQIKSRTSNGTMPPAGSGKSLTQEQIDLIACWVDDGALNN